MKAFTSHKCSLGCGLSLSSFPSLQREVFLWVFLVYFSSLKEEKPVADQGEGGGALIFRPNWGLKAPSPLISRSASGTENTPPNSNLSRSTLSFLIKFLRTSKFFMDKQVLVFFPIFQQNMKSSFPNIKPVDKILSMVFHFNGTWCILFVSIFYNDICDCS